MPDENNFLDGNHAFLMGEVMGALWKAKIDAEPVIDEDGNYMPEIIVKRPSGRYSIKVDPAP